MSDSEDSAEMTKGFFRKAIAIEADFLYNHTRKQRRIIEHGKDVKFHEVIDSAGTHY